MGQEQTRSEKASKEVRTKGDPDPGGLPPDDGSKTGAGVEGADPAESGKDQ